MKEKILEYLSNHQGARQRDIASFLKVWVADTDFLKVLYEMKENNIIQAVAYVDRANMENYCKWYIV